jgi:hypothetical protein
MNKMLRISNKFESGIALVSVLVFTALAMIVISMSTVLGVSSMGLNQGLIQSQSALYLAETGAENALLQLLRNPDYTSESLTLSEGTATISVSGTNPKIIDVVGKSIIFERKIRISVNYENGIMSVNSWQEVF